MRGIVSYGAYVPAYRLARARIAEALGTGAGAGHRAVASYDEDATSMGVEAARRALGDGLSPGSLHFATTAPPYLDKTNATAIHAALALPPDTFAVDAAGSVRSGVGALRSAAAAGGLAVLSDVRTGRPGSADESAGGDGAAAFLFGEGEHVVAELVAETSATAEFLDRWRTPGERGSHTWEERFGLDRYLPLIADVAERALKAGGVEAPDHVIVTSPHARAARVAGKSFGDAIADGLEDELGYAGAAHVGLALAEVLERAEAGQTILIVVAADGADAWVLRTTPALERRPRGGGLRRQLAHAREVDYATFLTWRGVLDREPPRRPDPDRPTAPAAARMERWKFGFGGSRCEDCGRVHLPPQRVCAGCGAVDRMAEQPLAGRRATVATYTVDRLAFSLSPPVIDAVLDFDGGGRFSCQMTDVSPEEVAIGGRAEMTFRRTHTADGVHNYFWKARPVVGGPVGEEGS